MKTIEISKFLSLILRHKPETVQLTLDEHGWADIDHLLEQCASHGYHFSKEELFKVVAENDKQRFAIDESGSRIRASQGHTVAVDLQLAPATPPAMLYHGTVEKFLDAIRQDGLQKMQRNHLHLSANLETAVNVGRRRGAPVILTIDSGRMHRDGFLFYLSDNGVWLTEFVPPAYISIPRQ